MKRIFLMLLTAFIAVSLAAQVPVHLELNSVTGVYEKGEKVEVYASLTEDYTESLTMHVTCSGKRLTSSNDLQLTVSEKTLIYSGSFDEASAINVSVGNLDDSKSFKTIGFVVNPGDYRPGFAEPEDLMSFWKSQIDALRASEMQVKATEVEHPDQADYVCYDLELTMPEGNPVRGYLAMPRNAAEGTLPIALLPHAAGVWKPHCQSTVKNAVRWAKKGGGVIAFDINAHGMLNGQPQEYYDNLDKTTLKDYAKRPLVSHEEFYFRLMYLRLVRAMDYLTGLKQWDGKRALVYGESQGAGQAGAIAALDSRISMAVMNVPAICDLGGVANELRGGWPSFYSKNINKPEVKDLSWSILPYYDVALLLKHTKAELVIECGLIDTTCPAECVYAAYNNAVNSVSKTILTYPRRSHRKVENPYYKEWELQVGNVRTKMMNEHLRQYYVPEVGKSPDPKMSVLAVEKRDGYECRYVEYTVETRRRLRDRVRAYLLVPDQVPPAERFPAVVMLHDHGARFDIGKEKLVRPMAAALENGADDHIVFSSRQWVEKYFDGVYLADSLAGQGYVVLVADALYWGERSCSDAQRWSELSYGKEGHLSHADRSLDIKTRKDTVKALKLRVYEGQRLMYDRLMAKNVIWAEKMLRDDVASVRLLKSLSYVDPENIGAFGFSMGAHRCWMLSAFCEDVKCGVALSWMTTLDRDAAMSASDYSMAVMPMREQLDFGDIGMFLAPKPMLFLNGKTDHLFPKEKVEKAFEKLHKHYSNCSEQLQTEFFNGGHHCGKSEQRRIFRYFDEHLKFY